MTVVVVNWNGREYLGACLAALQEQTRSPDEVVLVDNGSTDGSTELVARRFPQVRVIGSETNLGFAGGCNLGVRAARGDYVATLNPDTRPEPGWLAALVGAMDADPSVGMCASLMLFMETPDVVNSAGVAVDVLGIAWDRLGGQPVAAASEQQEVFGACGGAALYRRSLWEQLGGFDEDFFMYLEDVDLAWRARAAGWRCLYVPAARVYHAHSASAIEGSAFKDYLKARNKVWLIAKNYPWPQIALWGPCVILYDLLGVALTLSKGSTAALRGRIDGLRGLGPILAKRRVTCARGQTPGWRAVRPYLVGLQSPWTVRGRFAHL